MSALIADPARLLDVEQEAVCLDDLHATSAPTDAMLVDLDAGDLYFVGFNAATNEDLAFVVFNDVAPHTTLHFSTEEWNGQAIGSGGAFSGDGEACSWSSGETPITAGTVVVFSNLSAISKRAASVGTLSGDVTSVNLQNDGFFCFYGPDDQTPSRFVAAIGNGTAENTFTNLSGTGLVEGDTALALASGTDIGVYTGTRSGYTKAEFKTMVLDDSNWIRQISEGNSSGYDGIAPDVPFDDTAFTIANPDTLNSGDIAFVGYNSSNPDAFAFVALTDIAQATEINFTDKAWSNDSNAFIAVGNDWTGTWRASSDVTAGAVVTINNNNANIGTWSTSLDISTSGESILAYQGPSDNPSFVTGLYISLWTSANLPSALTPGLSAVHMLAPGDNNDGGYYHAIKTTGSVAALKTAINNDAAWHCEGNHVSFPDWSFTLRESAPALVSGDIAFIAYDLDNDRFAFVAMTALSTDTEIAFTDIGWDTTNLVPDVDINILEEQTAVWTAPEGGLAYGDVIRIQGTDVIGGGTLSGALDDLAGNGDQVLAFQGTVTNPTFIAAMGMYPWRSGEQPVSLEEHSFIPDGLSEGATAVQPTDSSALNHDRYLGPRFAPRETLLPAINTSSNWDVGNTRHTWWNPWNFSESPLSTIFTFQ